MQDAIIFAADTFHVTMVRQAAPQWSNGCALLSSTWLISLHQAEAHLSPVVEGVAVHNAPDLLDDGLGHASQAGGGQAQGAAAGGGRGVGQGVAPLPAADATVHPGTAKGGQS